MLSLPHYLIVQLHAVSAISKEHMLKYRRTHAPNRIIAFSLRDRRFRDIIIVPEIFDPSGRHGYFS